MQMVLLESLNVQSFLAIRSCINSPSQTRQERFGIIHITVEFKFNLLTQIELKTVCCTATQYCDGLRGALVIYDPDDPYKDS